MKKGLLLLVLMFFVGTQIVVNAHDLVVSDVQNSGCLSETREKRAIGFEEGYGETQTIILTKEGTNLHVQLLNYSSICLTEGFEVKSNISGGNNGSPLLLSVSVAAIDFLGADCICTYNVSFTINGLESNSFYFSCWWCEGIVNLTEGEPLVMEDITKDVSIDGLEYTIHESLHTAKLKNGKSWEGELRIPSEVSYEGQKYTVIDIISSAFSGNTALTSVTIPNSVTSIGGAAFKGCTGLTSIIIPESVKTIGYYAFQNCTNLANIAIPNSVSSISTDAFTGTAWYNNLPDGVVYIGNIVYTYKGTMPEGTSITIKEGTSMINQEAFSRCSNLTSVTIPESIKTIGEWAFMDCKSLTSVIIPGSVTMIGMGVFHNCSSLTSVVISEGVEIIGAVAFDGCSSLTSITIPSSVTTINDCAFYDCRKLTEVKCNATIPPTWQDGYVFYNVPIESATLHVPAVSVDKYKAAEFWKNFGNVVALTSDNLVTFTEGQMATIILPTTPDASKGKYYRLDRYEDGKIIFEEEPNPKARTPYIIVPNVDFSIDLNTLDLTGLDKDVVSIDGISFIGLYIQSEFDYNEDFYIEIIDITDDCRIEESAMGKSIIGPLRAFLQVSWDDPYHPGGTRGRGEKLEIVFQDNSNGLNEIHNPQSVNHTEGEIYDLSGRKINSQLIMHNSQLHKGIYIQNRKKVTIK